MSELISGKESLIALANGNCVQAQYKDQAHENCWFEILKTDQLAIFDRDDIQFRLKPRTVNLNGVEVGQLYSSQWDKYNPNKVTIEFRTEKEARHFSNNALKIFNGV